VQRRPLHLSPLARYLWSFKLTPAGRVLVVAIVVTALGSITTQLPIYQLFCGLLALLGVCELTGLAFKPSLRIDGWGPLRAAAGEPATATATVHNRSRWRPALDVSLGLFGLPGPVRQIDADRSLTALAPGESGPLAVTLLAEQRGIYPLPPLLSSSSFPFNFVRFGGGQTEPGRLVVLPRHHPLEECRIPASHRYQPGGVTLAQGLGHSPEYVGNREYVFGEPARHLDSKAWARLGKPVVKEYHDEYVSRIALVLDTYVPPRRFGRSGDARRFEAAVSLMAAIAERLNFHDQLVDLFAAGPELHVFRGLGGTTRFDAVLEILAGVDASPRNPFEQVAPLVAEELESISTVVGVFVDWDAQRADFVRHVHEAGCVLKGILVQDDDGRPQTGPDGSLLELGGRGDGDGWTIVTAADVAAGRVREL